MCHRSVGLIQNSIESAGIATVSISTKPEITMFVGVPRAGFLRFPLGNPIGERFNKTLQTQILMDLLTILREATGPGTLYELPYRWRKGRTR